jgi:hypothetical protein
MKNSPKQRVNKGVLFINSSQVQSSRYRVVLRKP